MVEERNPVAEAGAYGLCVSSRARHSVLHAVPRNDGVQAGVIRTSMARGIFVFQQLQKPGEIVIANS